MKGREVGEEIVLGSPPSRRTSSLVDRTGRELTRSWEEDTTSSITRMESWARTRRRGSWTTTTMRTSNLSPCPLPDPTRSPTLTDTPPFLSRPGGFRRTANPLPPSVQPRTRGRPPNPVSQQPTPSSSLDGKLVGLARKVPQP